MRIFKATFLFISILSAMIISSCAGDNEILLTAGESAWDEIEDEIEDKAKEYCKSFADDPQSLYGGCEADFTSLIDNFTITIPLDRTSHLATGLIFGEDAADFVSTVENYNRNKKSRQDVKKDLLNHFNSSWATLMTSLIILDGELTYEIETDDFMNPSFDFDQKALYLILNEKEYFNGAYGDAIQ